MIEHVLKGRNLREACRHVVSNRGVAGIDGMSVKELYVLTKAALQKSGEQISIGEYAIQSKELQGLTTEKLQQICDSIKTNKYVAQPLLGVHIPKGNGKTRLLGIPTVVDRMLQQAVHQTIGPLFEVEFKDHSYGYRPGRNPHQAVLRAQKNIHDGYDYIVDIDLKSFFDEVDHGLLLNLLYVKVKCPYILRLIRKWLRAPILVDGQLMKRRKGVPQGSPLSPLLSNIILHELDKELERRGHRYVRFADDFSIYTKSKKAARRVGNGIYLFLKNTFKLPINREKSGIRRPLTFQILGHRFVPTYKKGSKGQYQLVVSDKRWAQLKASLKLVTKKSNPMTFDKRIAEIKQIYQGWINYFRAGSIQSKLKTLDGWLRNRLRHCIWKAWKKPERKRKNLIRLGVHPELAYAWSRTRMGGWAVAQSPIMGQTITLSRLRQRGYESMSSYYAKVSPMLNEPLYARPARTVV